MTDSTTRVLTEMAERMLDKISHDPSTSFVELVPVAGAEARGDLEMHLPGHPNIVLWAGVSDAFIDALIEIQSRVEPSYVHPLVYLHDGAALSLPIVERIPKGGYKKPHWLPVTFALRKNTTRAHEDKLDKTRLRTLR